MTALEARERRGIIGALDTLCGIDAHDGPNAQKSQSMSEQQTPPRPPQRASPFRPESIRRIGLEKSVMADLYHFLLTTSWSRFFAIVIVGYILMNLVFAALYLLDPGALEGGTGHRFFDAFFFSVQTMATIGYGKMTPKTGFANILVTIEALFGLLGTAMATGLMFAKFSKPTSRVRFSKQVLIQRRDGAPTLLFRMANERSNQILEAQVHVALLLDETTKEGERLRKLRDLRLVRDTTPTFGLSWTVFHVIDEQSPLAGMSSEDLAKKNASIIVSLMGLDDTLSTTVHARQFYALEDIVFGQRFKDIITIDAEGVRTLDIGKIDETEAEPPEEQTSASAAPRAS